MKAGANSEDVRKIEKMSASGTKLADISEALGIEKDVVKAFMPKAKATKK